MSTHTQLVTAAREIGITSREPVRVAVSDSELRNGIWLLYIRCPYCGKTHQHGGGTEASPGLYGPRTPHCIDEYCRFMPDYSLEPAGYDDHADTIRGGAMVAELREAHQRVITRERKAQQEAAREFSRQVARAARSGSKEDQRSAYLAAIKAAYGEAK